MSLWEVCIGDQRKKHGAVIIQVKAINQSDAAQKAVREARLLGHSGHVAWARCVTITAGV